MKHLVLSKKAIKDIKEAPPNCGNGYKLNVI